MLNFVLVLQEMFFAIWVANSKFLGGKMVEEKPQNFLFFISCFSEN
jgi:hypothetical protein